VKKAQITKTKRYPSNYQVYRESIDGENGIIEVSTDGLIDGTYHDRPDNDDYYIEEGFEQYAINQANELLLAQGYEI
jgi:hypothetical protein